MQAKLFMIPWLIELVLAQNAPATAPVVPVAPPSAQALTNDLLVDAHHRHFYEMLRRQQQINDALLLNNALLHPHIPQLHIPTANEAAPLLPPAPLFPNPFAPPQPAQEGSTSKLGTYGKIEEDVTTTTESSKKSNLAAGVKTVSILKRKDDVTTTTLSPEDLEVVHLFKKLNLSKEETKSIVERVEQVVREKLSQKYKEEAAMSTTTPASTTTTSESTTTTSTTTTTTTTTTEPPTTTTATTTTETEAPTTMMIIEEEELEEEEAPIPTTTSTSAPPKMHVRSEENFILKRNNLKHHPIKLQRPKKLLPPNPPIEEEISGGSIKTSLTHLPIIVANEEEDVTQRATLHKRIQVATPIQKNPENDRDLLVDFATGAPLDLTDSDLLRTSGQKTSVSTSSAAPPTLPPAHPRMVTMNYLPPRQTHHEVTNFERLATDYRRRLENTGDIHKILSKISENAYISLVERGGPRRLFERN